VVEKVVEVEVVEVELSIVRTIFLAHEPTKSISELEEMGGLLEEIPM
jgi:hypothetical protein